MTGVQPACTSVLHPSAGKSDSALAFVHALRLAMKFRSRLTLLKVRSLDEPALTRSADIQKAREVCELWRQALGGGSGDPLEGWFDRNVSAVSVAARNPRSGILQFLQDGAHELVVLANHEHKGFANWLDVTTEQSLLRRSVVSSLFLRDGARGFVHPKTGALTLKTILVPIVDNPACMRALRRVEDLSLGISLGARLHLLHVGERAPDVKDEEGRRIDWPLIQRTGDVVATILDCAGELNVDMIAMPTAGRHGVLGAARGSVSACILDDARWPLLSVPMG